MLNVPPIIRQQLLQMIPISLVNDTRCFVFYDNHPYDRKHIDVTICTSKGEVIELYRRERVCSFFVNKPSEPSEIVIHRNSKCDMFYLVKVGNELLLLSRKDDIKLKHQVSNVESYSLIDDTCTGQALLTIAISDDVMPIIFDENLDSVEKILFSSLNDIDDNKDENIPILTELNMKLNLARFNTAFNTKSLEELKNIRQLAAFTLYQNLHPNLSNCVFNLGVKEITGALKIKPALPWIKSCNNYVVIIMTISNESNGNLDDVVVLLEKCHSAAMTYTTKLYQTIDQPPYWVEIRPSNILKQTSSAIVVVVDTNEVKEDVMSSIEISGVIMYKMNGKEKLLPFEKIAVSGLNTMEERFNVLFENVYDKNDILAILATSVKNDLVFRYIMNETEGSRISPRTISKTIDMVDFNMEGNMFIYRKSPYHTLNGTLLLFHNTEFPMKASVFTRKLCKIALKLSKILLIETYQVIALVNYITEALKARIIITTPSLRISSLTEDLKQYNEPLIADQPQPGNLNLFASKFLSLMTLVLQYYDECMISMNESRDEVIVAKVGSEIDLFACGVPKFLELKKQLNEGLDDAFNILNFYSKKYDTVEKMIVENSE